jgi:hypothetical protein
MYIFELANSTPLISWEIGQIPCKENPFVNFVVEETCRLFPEVVCYILTLGCSLSSLYNIMITTIFMFFDMSLS